MTQEKRKSQQGELRRRWRALIEDGSFARLRSEGRLVAIYVLYAADWSSCELKFSMRRVATFMSAQPTTVRRGVSQLIEAGILGVLDKGDGPRSSRFVVRECAPLVRTPDTSGAQDCAPLVRSPDTSRAQTAHEPCAVRTRAVRGVRTLCARNTFLFIGRPVSTNEYSNEASPGGGEEPPPARPEALESPESILPGGSNLTQEEDT
jgi:hypothetical protein